MRLKNFVCIALLTTALGVNAQSLSLRAVSGANLSGSTFFVSGSSFTIDVVLTITAPVTVSSFAGALAYANVASGSSSGLVNTAVAMGPLTISNKSYSSWATSTFSSNLSNFVGRAAAMSEANGYSTAGTDLPFVSYFARGSNPATTLQAGEYSLGTFTFDSSIAENDVFGDTSNESGLQMITQVGSGTPDLGASGYTGARVGSEKYKVQAQAVPEPATMLGLGAGLAAIARRRKNA